MNKQVRTPKFMKDQYQFLRYFAISFFVFLALDLVLLVRPLPWCSIEFFWGHLLLLPVGVLFGYYSGSGIHNATHRNLTPFWLNPIAGELFATQQAYGFIGYKTAHLIHHCYPDDPELDPHPPDGLPFWKFLLGMKKTMMRCLNRFYFAQFGDTPKTRRIFRVKNFFGFWSN